MLSHVLVYKDEGVSDHSFLQTCSSLKSSLDSDRFHIREVDNDFLQKEDWVSQATLIVIPGGRDRPYHRKLIGLGNRRIRQFVESGGAYLGICAGGYYGSAEIEFEKGGELEVCESRELSFFPGKAIGPALGMGQFCYTTSRGVHAAKLMWEADSELNSHIYFNGGCYFDLPHDDPSIEVMARFEEVKNTPPAIVKCKVGKGRAILCGVHPEISADNVRAAAQYDSYLNKVYPLIAASESKRLLLWQYLLEHCGLKP